MTTITPLLGLLSCLLALTAAAMSDQDCGEGRVRDLDGSCVKKFVIPKEKPVCPKLSIDNGDIFLLGEDKNGVIHIQKMMITELLIEILSTGRSLTELRNHSF